MLSTDYMNGINGKKWDGLLNRGNLWLSYIHLFFMQFSGGDYGVLVN